MAEIIIYIFQALYIFTSASLIGYPLYRKIYKTTPPDGPGLIRLVCFSFGFGAVILFFIAVALSYAPIGRGALAVGVTTLFPAWIVYRYRSEFKKLKTAVNGLFLVWAVFCAVMLSLSFSIVKMSVYPGLVSGTSGLADQIEYSGLAKSLFEKREYTAKYLGLDFIHQPSDLKEATQNHKIVNHVKNRLPFIPYLTYLYLNVFYSNPENIDHRIFSVLMCLYSSLLSGVIFCWVVSLNRSIKGADKFRYIPASFIIIAFLYTAFSTEFLISCLEILSVFYFLILLDLCYKQNHPYSKSRVLAVSLALIALFYIKGEGTALIASFILVIYAPQCAKRFLKAGAQGAVSCIMPLLFLAVAMSPWVWSSIKSGVTGNLSYNNYQTGCKEDRLVVSYTWFLKFIENQFKVSLAPCGAPLVSFTEEELGEYVGAFDHLDDYEKFALFNHLKRLRFKKNNIYTFNYMLGSQAYFPDDSELALKNGAFHNDNYSTLLVTHTVILIKKAILRMFSYLAWMIPWSSAFSFIAYTAGGFTWNAVVIWVASLLALTATYFYPRIFIQHLLLFILFEAILVTLNAAAGTLARFMLLLMPLVILTFTLLSNKVRLLGVIMRRPLGQFCFVMSVLFLTTFSLSLKAAELRRTVVNESDLKHIGRIVVENTEPDSIIISSLPQYISALTGRQSIGHSNYFMFLSGILDNFRPEYILFYDRPDKMSKEYTKHYLANAKASVLKDYKIVYHDPVRKFILFRKKAGTV